jgi:two-component system response regulator HydG
MSKILVIDDDLVICNLLEKFLAKNGYEVKTAFTSASAFEAIENETYDIVLTDFRLDNTDGKKILKRVKEKSPGTQVIIITGYSDVKIAVDVMKHGAFDYITKPFIPSEILRLLSKALEQKNGTEQEDETGEKSGSAAVAARKYTISESDYVVGKSAQAKEVERQIKLVAPTNYTVIIYGESGTGKESVAQAIHFNSPRKNKPFVAIDCGALSKELGASELFGHEKGAFTGALSQKIGQFEAANGGTIFFDEIANLTYDLQVSLLRVVQERKCRRLGSTKETNIDVRIVVASNESLAEAAAKGKFREDLYHRFNEFEINLSPLRERNVDIMLFAEHSLRKTNAELGKNIRRFSPEVINAFNKYSWPGNLRELNNIIKRVALLTDGEEVLLTSLPHEISFYDKFSFATDSTTSTEETTAMRAPVFRHDLKSVALNAEYEKIVEVLRKVNYNKSKAAKVLDIDRKTLYNKLRQYQLM